MLRLDNDDDDVNCPCESGGFSILLLGIYNEID